LWAAGVCPFTSSPSSLLPPSLLPPLTLSGTPYYQALEIWQRGKYTKSVDLWAAGVLLYVMVAKLQPWDYYFEEQFEEDEDFDPNVDQLRGMKRERRVRGKR
jgi:serine/threonine protein kinase